MDGKESNVARILLVGLGEDITDELQNRTEDNCIAYQELPKLMAQDGELLVASRRFLGQWLPVQKVVWHSYYEDYLPLLYAIAFSHATCFPDITRLIQLYDRHASLFYALQATAFPAPRSFVSVPAELVPGAPAVAKQGNMHCGWDKVRFDEPTTFEQPTLIEPFFEGESVRVLLIGDDVWQFHYVSEDWRKNVNGRVEKVQPDATLVTDARRIAAHLGLDIAGVDYIVGDKGTWLLEVNHFPGISDFPDVRSRYVDFVAEWIRQ